MRWISVLCLGGFLLLAADANAIPRLSARYGQNCGLCHQNPTGGGLRSPYASQFLLPTELALRHLTPEQMERIKPNLSESVTIGADLRTIHFWSDKKQVEGKNFFQMQGDLYVSFQASDHFFAYFDRSQFRSDEIFGAAFLLPWHGYVKFGRFTPDFGWKFEDHTHFTRDIVVRQPPLHSDAGVEVGVFPGRGAITLAMLNGAPGSSLYDDNDDLAFAARGLYRFQLGPAGVGLGGSYYTNAENQVRQRTGGPLAYVDWGRITWLGEADYSTLDPTGAAAVTQFITSHEFTLELKPGLDLLGTFDYADPDIDSKSGVRVKYGGGFDVRATPFIGFRGMAVFFRDQDLGAAGRNDTQTQVQAHIFY